MSKNLFSEQYSNHGLSYKQSSTRRVCITIPKKVVDLEIQYEKRFGMKPNRSQMYANFLKQLLENVPSD
ncbi:hypothetical protein [Mycoplasma capricolum]|uniref:hypothetical protein n=1 Tax=Mycoplasma capricolum TaxID=2095 RepID=UPI0022F3F8B3|nr:hypothetical protein [Mycoplasma capricolum]WBX36099.1 hypothetical protein NO343_04030 [Mycoplasma capricolum subsp. capricolum]